MKHLAMRFPSVGSAKIQKLIRIQISWIFQGYSRPWDEGSSSAPAYAPRQHHSRPSEGATKALGINASEARRVGANDQGPAAPLGKGADLTPPSLVVTSHVKQNAQFNYSTHDVTEVFHKPGAPHLVLLTPLSCALVVRC